MMKFNVNSVKVFFYVFGIKNGFVFILVFINIFRIRGSSGIRVGDLLLFIVDYFKARFLGKGKGFLCNY